MNLTFADGKIVMSFRYDPATIAVVKAIPGRKYDPKTKTWACPDCITTRAFIKHLLGIQLGYKACEPQEDPCQIESIVKPFAHQESIARTIAWCYQQNRGLGVFAETGTGKTKAVIDAIQHIQPPNVLIVVPPPLIFVWQREAEKHGMPLTVIHGPKRKIPNECGRWITSYQTLVNDVDKWKQTDIDMMVIDESQCVKNPSANRTKAVAAIECDSKIMLTGTPYGNNYQDVWSQIQIAYPGLFGPKSVFQSAFCEFGEYNEIIGYKNLELFMQILKRGAVVVRKVDCLDLPPKQYQTIDLSMGTKQRKAYLRAEAGAVGDMPITQVLVQIMKMRQISSGFVYYPDKETERFENKKVEYLQSIAWDTPTVIWYSFEPEREDIEKCLKEMGVSYTLSNGRNDSRRAVESFEGQKSSVLVAQIQSLQYGVTLNRASRVIYYSPTFSSLARSQSEDRCHRIGQDKSVLYVDLITSDIERWILESMTTKVEVRDYILKKLVDKRH